MQNSDEEMRKKFTKELETTVELGGTIEYHYKRKKNSVFQSWRAMDMIHRLKRSCGCGRPNPWC